MVGFVPTILSVKYLKKQHKSGAEEMRGETIWTVMVCSAVCSCMYVMEAAIYACRVDTTFYFVIVWVRMFDVSLGSAVWLIVALAATSHWSIETTAGMMLMMKKHLCTA